MPLYGEIYSGVLEMPQIAVFQAGLWNADVIVESLS